jgi:hypothetical protein
MPSRRSMFLRRAGLLVVGMAPFVFFLLLLPAETAREGSTPATVAPSPSLDQVPLAFPFLESPAPEPSSEQAESSPSLSASPSLRPANTTIPSPAPGTTIPGPAPSPAAAANRFGAPPAACSNGVDDDGDGSADLSDPGCSSGGDHAESDNPACSDGLDDDGDGTVDSGDPGCSDAKDRSEADDNVIPTDNPPNPPEEPGGGLGPGDPEDPFILDGLPS